MGEGAAGGFVVTVVMGVGIMGRDMALAHVGQGWRGFRVRGSWAVEAVFEFIAQRAQRVARGAVGGRLGREDKGIGGRAAAVVARADDGPVLRASVSLCCHVCVYVCMYRLVKGQLLAWPLGLRAWRCMHAYGLSAAIDSDRRPRQRPRTARPRQQQKTRRAGSRGVPQVYDAVVDVGDGVGAAAGGRVARGGVDGGIAGAARAGPALELLSRVLDPAQAARIVGAAFGRVGGCGRRRRRGRGRGHLVALGMGWQVILRQSRQGHCPP